MIDRPPTLAVFHFSLPGLVQGKVSGPEWLIAPVRHELSAYEATGAEGTDLDVELRIAASPKKSDAEFYWSGSHLGARWTVGAQFIAPSGAAVESGRDQSRPYNMIIPEPREKLALTFHGDRASRFIISKWIVEPALRMIAEQRGAVMPHAAGITDGERALLIAGRGGAGKTTWVLNWLGQGHPYLSDDFSILREGKVWPYLTPLRLSARNLISNPVLSRMAFRDQAEIVLRALLRRALLGRVRFSFKAPIQRAVPDVKIAGPAELAGAVWIRGEKKRAAEVTRAPQGSEISAEQMAELMTDCDREETHGFGPALLDRRAAPAETNSAFWDQHRKKLLAAFQSKPCFRLAALRLPPPPALSSISAFIAWLKNE